MLDEKVLVTYCDISEHPMPYRLTVLADWGFSGEKKVAENKEELKVELLKMMLRSEEGKERPSPYIRPDLQELYDSLPEPEDDGEDEE